MYVLEGLGGIIWDEIGMYWDGMYLGEELACN